MELCVRGPSFFSARARIKGGPQSGGASRHADFCVGPPTMSGSMPATRLDRLVSLLDIGSSSLIRTTAATQLGQIAALRVRGASTAHEGASSSEMTMSLGHLSRIGKPVTNSMASHTATPASSGRTPSSWRPHATARTLAA